MLRGRLKESPLNMPCLMVIDSESITCPCQYILRRIDQHQRLVKDLSKMCGLRGQAKKHIGQMVGSQSDYFLE